MAEPVELKGMIAITNVYAEALLRQLEEDDETIAILEAACRAAQIFHGPYGGRCRAEWRKITGTSEINTQELRAVLNHAVDRADRRRRGNG